MEIVFVILTVLFVYFYRQKSEGSVYKYIVTQVSETYEKYAPYTYKQIRDKVKALGLEYTTKQYTIQIILFAGGAFVISYLYFYNIVISLVYVALAIFIIPYISYLRYKRTYSEYIFEQIQVYTTNTIMEFAVTDSFVKALEGVYASGVLEDPVLSDVKHMIDLAYQNGSIDESIKYMNSKYDYHIIRNMHQLFYQITKEGSLDSKDVMDSMLIDIDMLVESVYKDRIDRKTFHRSFLQYGLLLYFLVMLLQYLLGIDAYIQLLDKVFVQIILHAVVLSNSFFLINGEKYYNENVGAE